MKVLIDTNVILDVLCNRKDFVEASAKIFKLCEVKQITGYVSALSVANIVYVMRKELDTERIKQILDTLSLIFQITDLKAEDLECACKLDFKDFEDAIQSAQATRLKVDYIITRNIKDYVKSKAMAIKPSELLDRI